jgi:hypothetical protein
VSLAKVIRTIKDLTIECTIFKKSPLTPLYQRGVFYTSLWKREARWDFTINVLYYKIVSK